ncbi:MAG TPA: helix-turn-helix transcriptional regulator [Flexivirga sp.]|uniref:helix-turn-helix transcriptional regulator n=1 Tax=Flexivirga sp. TaxID=1962927 RepID=UPI002D00FBC5|nr:helix-turn-helix transcriptional regulator [Flexivirga sp.]HWC23087.1 helix-turn-helix transcriptional regulator [Flexivirga sp.]
MTARETSAAVGARIREARESRGISLSALARDAGIGKATLSQLEAGERNPTIETLYAICGPLGVPLSALVGETGGSEAAAAGGMRTVLLDLRRRPDGTTVEVFRLEFPAGARHTSAAHGRSVTEHLVVTSGAIRVRMARSELISVGESTTWTSDRRHSYAAVGGAAEAVLVITTPAAQ